MVEQDRTYSSYLGLEKILRKQQNAAIVSNAAYHENYRCEISRNNVSIKTLTDLY